MSAQLRVKICGLTSLADAQLACDLGADALGFVFWPRSPRSISVQDASVITRHLPPFVTRVGVFVDATPDEVAAAVREAGIDVAQLHGSEGLSAFRSVGARLIRVANLVADVDVETVAAWPADVMPIVDAHDPERRGGTGRPADWTRAAELARRRPIVLAGGLHAENVGEAIRRVRPWAVDVSSGVESAPGRKSPERLRAFFAAVAAVQLEDL